ncbi:hypothetical protein PSACC_01812 [Paramicrosporidium saccamoebae]|uniref:FAS1 domain-containing protein n=1 Tax=Paramicrosporidium saccamoebae TaxID=1246581 RepID=A0A2H9TL18_9FUNG|nr:hypothetical protein PSACC_01812 [Paramicrosporidium saccamoebae]
MTDFTGFENLNCSDTNVTDCPRLLSGNLSALRVEDVASCIPLMAAYHLVNGTYSNLYNCTDSMNITVIPSALNMTYDHSYQGVNMSQVIISHVTPDEAHVHSGGNSTAYVTNAYPARDGHVYLIDRVLIPPLFLNYTLNAFNISQPLNTTEMLGGNQTFTVFLPINQANTTLPSNATSYVLPQLFYLNQTEPTTVNLTALNGNQIMLSVQQNNTVTLNGNVTVVRGNIPLVNGVLHLVNDTLGAANISNTAAAYALRQNMNHWRHWIHNH